MRSIGCYFCSFVEGGFEGEQYFRHRLLRSTDYCLLIDDSIGVQVEGSGSRSSIRCKALESILRQGMVVEGNG
jgi:hypothetical protein